MTSDSEGGSEARRLILADQLRQAERRAATFRVVSTIGHLIGTPLNVIAARAALIRTGGDSDHVEHARRIEEQVERLAHEIRRLIEYLTPLEPSSEPASVASVVADVAALCGPVAAARGVSITLPPLLDDSVYVPAAPALLVLTTLLSLSVRLSAPGATVRLDVKLDSGNLMRFELTTQGAEYPRGRIDRLEPPEQLGPANAEAMQALSMCFAVAQRQGGSVQLERGASGVSTVAFTCPRVN